MNQMIGSPLNKPVKEDDFDMAEVFIYGDSVLIFDGIFEGKTGKVINGIEGLGYLVNVKLGLFKREPHWFSPNAICKEE